MTKRKTLQKIKALFKNWKEIEICIKNNYKDQMQIIKKYMNRLLTSKKY